jgi:hypothetical protein
LPQPIDALADFLEQNRDGGLHPILWIGAGASAAAGYPTMATIEAFLRPRLPDSREAGFTLIADFVAELGEAELARVLDESVAEPRPFAPIHTAVARLASAGICPLLFTTNHDQTVEAAFDEAGVTFGVHCLEDDYVLEGGGGVQIIRLHCDPGDWRAAVRAVASLRAFEASYPRLVHHLDRNLRTRPVIFVGCSMRDPRLLDWLATLPIPDRRDLHASRAILTQEEWFRLAPPNRDLLTMANVKPILVPDHESVTGLLVEMAGRME